MNVVEKAKDKVNKHSADKISLFQTLKQSVLFFIKAETNSTEGKLNLIGGVAIIVYVFLCATGSLIEKIFSFINPNYKNSMTTFDITINMIIIVAYFMFCVLITTRLKRKTENT